MYTEQQSEGYFYIAHAGMRHKIIVTIALEGRAVRNQAQSNRPP